MIEGSHGGPEKILIKQKMIEDLRTLGFSLSEIKTITGVSRATASRWMSSRSSRISPRAAKAVANAWSAIFELARVMAREMIDQGIPRPPLDDLDSDEWKVWTEEQRYRTTVAVVSIVDSIFRDRG